MFPNWTRKILCKTTVIKLAIFIICVVENEHAFATRLIKKIIKSCKLLFEIFLKIQVNDYIFSYLFTYCFSCLAERRYQLLFCFSGQPKDVPFIKFPQVHKMTNKGGFSNTSHTRYNGQIWRTATCKTIFQYLQIFVPSSEIVYAFVYAKMKRW